MQGEERAKYGAEIIKKLSKELSAEYGKGFTKSNLYSFYSFYKTYPEIFQTLSGKSQRLLSWSHYVVLLQVNDEKARGWYEWNSVKSMLLWQDNNIFIRKSRIILLTLGIVLCADTDEDIAKYSVLHGNEQLFASKYKLYLPTEELRAEIETQKAMFYLQQNEKKDRHICSNQLFIYE